MKKKLLLITNGFPFGESERSFLNTEFQHLCREFQVHILAHSQEALLYPLPDGVKAERYEYGFIFRPRRLADVPSFLQLLIHPFRPSVFCELRRALRHCTPRQALARAVSILGYSVSAWQLEKRFRRITVDEGTDLVYTYWCTQATLAAVRLKKHCPRLKVVTRFHGYDLYQERRSDSWQPFREEISRGCDRLIFAAEAGRRYYLETWGQKLTDKCAVCFLGSREMTVVQRSSNKLTLVSCSNLIPLKRVGLIIDALALLPESLHVEWHHFGDGQEREDLTARAERTLPPYIRWKFWGHIPNCQLNRIYQSLNPDLFITTTSTEGGIPVSIQEAFSCGIPAAAACVDSIPEIVHDGKTGFLMSSNPSAQEIASVIQRFHDLSPSERTAMSVAARSAWECFFHAESNGKRTAHLLRSICQDIDGFKPAKSRCPQCENSSVQNAPPPQT